MANKNIAKVEKAIVAKRNAVKKLKTLIIDISNDVNLDMDKTAARLDSAMRSEYGQVNGLINLISAIAAWPATPGDGTAVSRNKLMLEEKYKLDLLLLDDIRKLRGFHTFVTDDLEILEGQEPDCDNYSDYCKVFLKEMGIKIDTPSIRLEQWQRAEAKAKVKALEEVESMKEAINKHNEFIASKA